MHARTSGDKHKSMENTGWRNLKTSRSDCFQRMGGYIKDRYKFLALPVIRRRSACQNSSFDEACEKASLTKIN